MWIIESKGQSFRVSQEFGIGGRPLEFRTEGDACSYLAGWPEDVMPEDARVVWGGRPAPRLARWVWFRAANLSVDIIRKGRRASGFRGWVAMKCLTLQCWLGARYGITHNDFKGQWPR